MSKLRGASSVSALFLCFSLMVFAGEPKPSPQESTAPYWTAEPGWHTEFQLKNNLAQSDLTVTPVLRMKGGRGVAA